MNLRWLFFDHVPPGVSLNADQRRELKRRAATLRTQARSSRLENIRWVLVVCGAGFAAAGLMFLVMSWTLPRTQLASVRLLAIFSNPVIVTVVFWLAIAGYYNRSHARYVRRALNEMGFPVCEQCGYPMHDLRDDSTRCPECGAERSPNSVNKEPTS